VVFDCNYGRDEAIQRINRKESDWYKMIPEEEKEKEGKKEELKDYKKRHQDKGKHTPGFRKEKVKTDINKEEPYNDEYEKEERPSNNVTYLTIWDLPADINKKEVEYICRRIKDVQIVCIKRFKYKALAIIQMQSIREEDILWSLPADNNKLVRVTRGREDHEAREGQRKHAAKLTELPGNASEVLLLRCLRSKGAKSVYIPPNRNGNQKRTALITFATEEDMKAAQSKPIMYNNFQVYWVNGKEKELKRRGNFKDRRGRSWDRSGQNSDTEEDESRERNQWNRTYMNRKNDRRKLIPKAQTIEEGNNSLRHSTKNQRRYRSTDREKEESQEKREKRDKMHQQEKNTHTHIEDILGQILGRLEKLEEVSVSIGEGTANRS
jgi:hypothetical protein